MKCPVCEIPFTPEHVRQHEKIVINIYKRTTDGRPRYSDGSLFSDVYQPMNGECGGERLCFSCLLSMFSDSPVDANTGPHRCLKCDCWFCYKCVKEYGMVADDEFHISDNCLGCQLGAKISYK